MTTSDFKETLKQQADIVRIVGEYVKLKKAGAQNFSGLCPFHGEKTPSFSVHATRQFYHCFGCGASGDVFSFVQKVENVSFPEAVRLIAQKLGVPMPKVQFSSPQEARDAKLRMALLDVHERAAEFFQQCIRRPEGAHAREYLKGRGLNEEMVKEFRIGFAPDSGFLLRDALRREFDEETLREGGLFSWKDSQPSAASAEGRGPSTHVSSLRSGALAQDDNAEGGSSGSARDDRNAVRGSENPGISEEGRGPSARVSSLRSGALAQDDNAEGGSSGSARDDNAGRGSSNSARDARGHKAGTRADAAAMYSKFRNRVMFPITNEQGKVIAFTGRTLATDEKAGPKYLNSPETKIYSKSRVLFNLDHAKEAIRKLEYSILVEGQMDCISVYAAGFHNVIASSGTAFTELQAKLLGRFSKNIIVNFDPDTAGARATERTLGLLVEEEFNIRVLTLETGFDPDLFIRRKGREAYGAALKHSQKYFDYLIERARAQFGARSGEAKAKAVNWLLPHVQRVPSRIVRDELAMEISQKLGIDSGVLRQELKHAATTRETVAVKAPAEAQVTPAERVLIRALASAREMQAGEGRSSAREGTDEEFDPARQAQFALTAERLHEGLAAESLIAALLDAGEFGGDPLELARSDEDRRLLASVLMHDDEELTPHTVEGAVRALRRITLRKRLDEVQRRMVAPGVAMQEKQALLQERVRLKRSLMDPGLEEAS